MYCQDIYCDVYWLCLSRPGNATGSVCSHNRTAPLDLPDDGIIPCCRRRLGRSRSIPSETSGNPFNNVNTNETVEMEKKPLPTYTNSSGYIMGAKSMSCGSRVQTTLRETSIQSFKSSCCCCTLTDGYIR